MQPSVWVVVDNTNGNIESIWSSLKSAQAEAERCIAGYGLHSSVVEEWTLNENHGPLKVFHFLATGWFPE